MSDGDSAPQFVCVPGLGLDAASWQPTIAQLGAAVRHPVVVTLPGFGLRATAEDDLTPTGLAAWLVARRLGAINGPVVLAGHSASSQIVLHAAALVPDRVAAVVLVGPTTDPRAASWTALVRRGLLTAVREQPGQAPLLVRSYARTGLRSMARAMDAARHDDAVRSAATIRCPLLVVRGPHDFISPDDWARSLVDAAPAGSSAVTLSRGAHMVPLTHGEPVASVVRRFLASLGQT